MKVLSLNTHSLIEENYGEKLKETIRGFAEETPDFIALQEVNQTMVKAGVELDGYYCSTVKIKEDNYALRVQKELQLLGRDYYWAYCPCHIGYDMYDEGVALLSKYPILEVREVLVSNASAYDNYLTRRCLLARVQVGEETFLIAVVHLGWWQGTKESFAAQWDKLLLAIKGMAKAEELIFIMGDLNNPSHIVGEGYSYVLNSGYFDTYNMAIKKDIGYTATSKIDGWDSKQDEKIRIDYILANQQLVVENHQRIFDGDKYGVVSDHFGIIVEMKRS